MGLTSIAGMALKLSVFPPESDWLLDFSTGIAWFSGSIFLMDSTLWLLFISEFPDSSDVIAGDDSLIFLIIDSGVKTKNPRYHAITIVQNVAIDCGPTIQNIFLLKASLAPSAK